MATVDGESLNPSLIKVQNGNPIHSWRAPSLGEYYACVWRDSHRDSLQNANVIFYGSGVYDTRSRARCKSWHELTNHRTPDTRARVVHSSQHLLMGIESGPGLPSMAHCSLLSTCGSYWHYRLSVSVNHPVPFLIYKYPYPFQPEGITLHY